MSACRLRVRGISQFAYSNSNQIGNMDSGAALNTSTMRRACLRVEKLFE
jgi:hypothetical protein